MLSKLPAPPFPPEPLLLNLFMSFIASRPMGTVVASELFFPPPLVGRLVFVDGGCVAGGVDIADDVAFDFF